MVHFQDPISQDKLAGIASRAGQKRLSIYTVSRFGPSSKALTSGVNAVLSPGDDLTVYLMLVYTLEVAHDLAFLATLDYTPLQVTFDGAQQALPTTRFEPGTTRAFRLSLTEVPEGLHALVISYLIDPDYYPDFPHPEPDERLAEYVGLSALPFELGITLYVTPTPPATITDWPAQARAFPPDETVHLSQAVLMDNCPPDGSRMVLTRDTATAGQDKAYLVRFTGSAYTEAAQCPDMPVRILVFWDEVLTQVEDLDVPVGDCEQRTCFPLAVRVPGDLTPGTHSLTVMAYPYPYYLRSWRMADGSFAWLANTTYMGYPMGRVSVEVSG